MHEMLFVFLFLCVALLNNLFKIFLFARGSVFMPMAMFLISYIVHLLFFRGVLNHIQIFIDLFLGLGRIYHDLSGAFVQLFMLFDFVIQKEASD